MGGYLEKLTGGTKRAATNAGNKTAAEIPAGQPQSVPGPPGGVSPSGGMVTNNPQLKPNYSAIMRNAREEGMRKGEEVGKGIQLERYKTPDDIAAARAQALQGARDTAEGLNSAEGRALRDQGMANIGAQEQSNLRQLRGITGSQGMQGPAAAAMQQQALQQSMLARQGLERDLAVENIAQRRMGLQNLNNTASNQAGQAYTEGTYNIGQGGKEQFARATLPLEYGQMYAGNEAAGGMLDVYGNMADDAARRAANAPEPQTSSGNNGMWEQWKKPFDDVSNYISARDPVGKGIERSTGWNPHRYWEVNK